jgi:chromosomal replication initiator protein
VAAYFDLQPADICGAKRDKEIVVPRQITMYLMREELGLSFPKIAAAIGGRDHTTAMHSVTKIEKQIEADDNLRGDIAGDPRAPETRSLNRASGCSL